MCSIFFSKWENNKGRQSWWWGNTDQQAEGFSKTARKDRHCVPAGSRGSPRPRYKEHGESAPSTKRISWIIREMPLCRPFVSRGGSEKPGISEHCASAGEQSEMTALCVLGKRVCIFISRPQRNKWIQIRVLKKIAVAFQVLFQRAVWRQCNCLLFFLRGQKY